MTASLLLMTCALWCALSVPLALWLARVLWRRGMTENVQGE